MVTRRRADAAYMNRSVGEVSRGGALDGSLSSAGVGFVDVAVAH